ncbi:MAG: phosphate transport system permease protein PstA [Geminicoccaceae bacterium]|jgi:phosphate transport system permease protein|nr:MAG: phosphate transport system permease protein PstA [Geminicoccaceae bacterium]
MASLSPSISIEATGSGVADIRANVARRRRWDVLFAAFGLLATSVGVITLLALFIDLLIDGYHRLTPDFFLSFPSRRASEAGILSAWVGTCLVMLVTAVVGVPIAVSAGIYLEEYAPKNWVTTLIEINVSNLAAVPSIVYGLLALGLFVYALGFGQSVLSAGLTLALMIMPVIVVATREAVRAVPHAIREAAYAAGATRWQVTRDHVLPYSVPGIATGVIIGLARAIGETAPLITIGALTFIAYLPDPPLSTTPPYVSFDWLWSGFTVLPIQMFNWVSRPGTAFHANAAAAGIVIVVLTLLMNAFAIYLRYRLRKKINW